MSYMSTLTIRVPDRLRRQLERLSRHQDRPVSDLARDALRRYLTVQRFYELRRQTISLAQPQKLLTDDDIFRTVS